MVRTTIRGSGSAIGGIRLAGEPVVRLSIAGDARRSSCARSRRKRRAAGPQLRPAPPVGKQIQDLGRKRVDVARLEQHSPFPGRGSARGGRRRPEATSKRPCAIASSGLSGVTSSGEAHRQSRIDQHVDELVVTVHFVVGNAADEADLVVERDLAAICFSLASSGPPPTRSDATRGSAARILGNASSSSASPSYA